VSFAAAVFLGSVVFAGYAIAGYPLLLGWLSRRGRPVTRVFEPRTVTVIVAVRNGEYFLRAKLESILGLDYPRELLEIVVVSDGSTDATESIAADFAASGVRLLRIPPSGKPAALNAAIPEARGDILLLTDVRQALDPPSLRHLVACFADPTVGGVSGALRIRAGTSSAEADIGMYWRYETWIRSRLARIDSMFGATGPFYALRHSLAVPLPPEILLDDMYLPLAGFFRGYRLITEDRAIAWDYPTSRETEFRRKVRTLAGNYQILRYYPELLGPRNRMWLHFVSYKLARLLLPWALVATAIATFWLPDPLRLEAAVAQGAFYLLAALDGVVPSGFPLKRLSSPARTFTTMMLAAVCGLAVFFVPPQRLWKITSTTPRK
jgi:cellulose synthase/poly-beta-1,6-N-acetylglucosamine synthase-like glycosyltransferase